MNTNLLNKEINYAVISDIHLGNRRNTASEMIVNLRAAFPDNYETSILDVIFIAGDLFDDLLVLNDSDVWEIKFWVADLLRLCKKHDIMIRVLEGTPSHDRKQPIMFPNTNDSAKIGANLKYVDTISIEHIQELGKTILYVPDEASPTTEETLSQIKELLKAKGLEKVDIIIMHGQFEYQLPEHIKAQKHDSSEYLKIVKYYVHIGHIHVYSAFKDIYAQGSFDRISHGEESPKGHVRVTIKGDDKKIRFVENVGAKIFKSVDCEDMDLDSTIRKITEVAEKLPSGSFIRIKASSKNPILSNVVSLITMFPLLTWSKLVVADKSEEQMISEEEVIFQPVQISATNVEGLLMDKITRVTNDIRIIDMSRKLLKDLINE